MTPAAKIVYSLACMIGLFLGTFWGFRMDLTALKIYHDMRPSIPPMAFDDFAFMQYRYADTEHAESTLLSFAALLEKLEALSPDKEEQLNLSETYIRLALLEDSTHNAQASNDYMAKARYWYAASGGKHQSDSETKAGLINYDKQLEQFGFH
jgi:hypothetical protein